MDLHENNKLSTVSYNHLNDVLNKVFFDGRNRLAPVYLFLEGALAEEVAEKLEIDPRNLEEVLGRSTAKTLCRLTGNPYEYHLRAFASWNRLPNKPPPPFTALLCTLALAAARMSEDAHYSANDYYHRLFDLLGESSATMQGHLKAYAVCTSYLWKGLNLWLMESDFEYGRPTARQVNSWKYVSYGLSQALIRDADKQKLSRLFSSLDLAPGEVVTEGEMALFLHEWMTTQGPSKRLKSIWAVDDLREKLIGAAILELQSWTGGSRLELRGCKSRRLFWIASFGSFPKRSLRLNLVAAGMPAQVNGLSFDAGIHEGSISAFCACLDQLRMVPLSGTEYSVLEPISKIVISDLLTTPFLLHDLSGGFKFNYVPKPIIPLVKADSGHFFREAPRVSLFNYHYILCHEKWLDKVSNYLSSAARPGYKLQNSEALHGLPAGWNLLQNVEIIHVLDNVDPSLQMLVPISGVATIEFTGGLKLGPSLWHLGAPPIVNATAEGVGIELAVFNMAFGENNEHVLLRRGGSAGTFDVPLSDLQEKSSSNLRVALIKGHNELSEKSISFRDADTPRARSEGGMAYVVTPENPISIISAQHIVIDSGFAGCVRGMNVSVASGSGCIPEIPAQVLGLNDVSGSLEEEDLLTEDYKLGSGDGVNLSCVIRGYHCWNIPPFEKGDDRYEAKHMRCQDCGLTSYSRSRASARALRYKIQDGDNIKKISRGHTVLGSLVRDCPTIETLFDGLCYLGTGKWSSFSSLAASCSNEPWFEAQLARDLVSLGCIDLMYGPDLRPLEWAIACPTLVIPREDSGACYLAGYRSQRFVAQVRVALEKQGAVYEPLATSGSLMVHKWLGLGCDKIISAIKGVVDPHGRPIKLSLQPGSHLAFSLPRLSAIRDIMPLIHVDSLDGLETFNVSKGKWERAAKTSNPGAYRTNFAGRRYFLREVDGTCREGPHEVIKTLAAGMEGIRLHGYHERRQEFISALGCEPPGLYSRALVACSGKLPRKIDGRLIYEDVPSNVAFAIINKLYSQGDSHEKTNSPGSAVLHPRVIS